MADHPIDVHALGQALSDEYELRAALGRGGYGSVFSALRKRDAQMVAIKVQRLASADDAAERELRVARFEREARLCAALDHPNIVRLMDKGRRGDFLVLVLELIPGETLTEYLRRNGPLALTDTVELASQILDALQQAHSRAIVHRDLKPDNLMLLSASGPPRVKVLDFGVGAFTAGAVERGPTLTRSHEVLGTPCYSAPEQLRGEPATARSDLYSWGLLFLECLTGKRVMDGTLAQVFHKQLSLLDVELPASLATHPLGALLRRALAKDPRQRFPHAGRLRQELLSTPLNDLVDMFGGAVGRGAPTVVVDAPRLVGELRQATALCCSLGVLSSLPGATDVELLDAVQRDQLRACIEIVRRFGGQVLGTLANRVLVVFGLPQASDSDARRAARAALELTSSVAARRALLAMQHGIDLELRIGMDTGPVIVDEYGELSGPVLNEATRLEGLAEPAMTLLSVTTHRLLHKQWRLEELHGTRGAGSASKLYTLVAEGPIEPFGSPAAPLSEFVGRQLELERLLGYWGDAQAGRGRVVTVRGEAGVGKSRLVAELCQRARQSGSQVLGTRCSPEHLRSALHPLGRLCRQRFGDESGADGADRLARELSLAGERASDALPVLCQWLGLTATKQQAAPSLAPEWQRELLLDALAALHCSPDGGAPAIFVVEDVQWSDASTRELLARIEQRVTSHRTLVLLTVRSEAGELPPLGEVVELAGLDVEAARLLLSLLSGDALMSDSEASAVIARTDGVPLFIEEVTRSRGESQDVSLSVSLLDTPVPASLRDLLHGRLDRLGAAKETAQIAAAIGREFDLELLHAVSARGAEVLLAELNSLVDAGVAVFQQFAGAGRYSFRHALTREVALDSMRSAHRSAVHRGIAQQLERRRDQGTEVDPGRLAHHFESAGMPDSATRYSLLAGQRASGDAAYVEALGHFQRALANVTRLSDEAQRTGLELDILNARGAALIASRGFGTQEVEETFTRAGELSRRTGAKIEQRFTALTGLWTYHNTRANFGEATLLSEKLRQIAENEQSSELLLVAHAAGCQTATVTGNFVVALEHATACEPGPDPGQQRVLLARYGVDQWLVALSFGAMCNVLVGRISLARRQMRAGFEFVRELGSPVNEANLFGQMAGIELFLGSAGPSNNAALKRCTEQAQAGLALAERHGLMHAAAYNAFLAAAANLEQSEASRAHLEQSLGLWEMAGVRASASWRLCYIARAKRARGDFVGAHESAARALVHCQETGEGYGLSEAHRVLALVLADSANPDADRTRALREYREAREVARRQGARWLELRAAYSGAEQLGDPESVAEAQAAVRWFLDNGEADNELVQECQTLYQL